mgnify:CR=1 FL=1|jgi:hypothetical protein
MTKREEVIEFINNELNTETHELRMGERILFSPDEALVNTNDVGTASYKHQDKERLIEIMVEQFDEDMKSLNGTISVQVMFWYAHPRLVEGV